MHKEATLLEKIFFYRILVMLSFCVGEKHQMMCFECVPKIKNKKFLYSRVLPDNMNQPLIG